MNAKPPRPPAPDPGVTNVMAPSDEPKLSWWRRGWGVALIGVICLLIGVAIGAAGNNSKKKAPPTAAQLAAQASAAKLRIREEAGAKATSERERIATEKREAAQHAAEHRAAVRQGHKEAAEQRHEQQEERKAEERKKAEETKTYTGTGGENLGTIHVPTQSTLHWNCPPCASDNFSISNNPSDEQHIFVNTINRTEGETHVDEGTYHDVEVNSEGESWTIHITPNE